MSKITSKKTAEDAKKQVSTEAVVTGREDPPAEKPKPKSVTRVGPEDECTDDEAFGQETKNADARPEGGDVPK